MSEPRSHPNTYLYRRKEKTNGPRAVHRHLQRSHRPAGGGVLPAPLPALPERPRPAPTAPLPPGSPGRRHTGRDPLPESPPGHQRRGGDGHRQDLHRRIRSLRRWLQAGARPHAPAPDPEVEAGGGADGAQGPRCHRRLHHRPGEAAPLHRPRPPLRHHVKRTGEALLPLAGGIHRAVGHIQGRAHPGRGDGGALPVPLLPYLRQPDCGQGRCAPHRRGDGAQAAHLRRVRLRPVAGRPQGAEAISTRRLHQEADEGVLRAARNRRGA